MTNWLRQVRARLRNRHFERDLADELAHHRALKAEELLRGGVAPREAGDEVIRTMGNELYAREEARAVWIPTFLEAIVQDLRHGLRGLRRDRAFSTAAIATLALGIGANLAIFRFLDAVLLEDLPVHRPAELVQVRPWAFSYPQYLELTAATREVFSETAARWPVQVTISAGGAVQRVPAELVSGSYFRTLGLRPHLGRLIEDADDGAEGSHRVCVISHRLWWRLFGGDVEAVGRFVRLNGEPFQVIGVTGPRFAGGDIHARFEAQIPMSMTALVAGMPRDSGAWSWLTMSARLRHGVSREQAEHVMRARFKPAYDWQKREPIRLQEGRQGAASLRSELKNPVLIAQLLSAAVLLIALANLAGLLVARMSARQREVGIRNALGASRGRIASAVFAESLLLSAAAGGAAWGVAALLHGFLGGMLRRPGTNFDLAASGNWVALGVPSVFVLLSALGIGIVPALLATRSERPLDAIQEVPGTRRRQGWAGWAFALVQTVVSLFLVFAAILFARSLYNLRSVELGFDPRRVVVMTTDPGSIGYTPERTAALQEEWLRRARLIPGVEAAGLASVTALSGMMFAGPVHVADAPPGPRPERNNYVNVVSSGYFESVGLRMVAGRTFGEHDTPSAQRVAIVNEAFVDHYWPGRSALGRRFSLFTRQHVVEVIGVARTAKYGEVREDPQIVVYLPFTQRPPNAMTLHVRVEGDEAGVIEALRTAIQDIDPAVPVYGAARLEDFVDARLSKERVLNLLAVLFAALALLVAAVGLHGRVAHSVVRRRREIGIRLALGAPRPSILRLFVADTVRLVALSLVLGIPLSILIGRQFAVVLYRVEPESLSLISAAAALLAGVSIVAAVLPASRAIGLDPKITLREQ